MFLSPVFYPATAVPESLRALYHFNPLTLIIEDFRRVALWGKPPQWDGWLMTLIIGFVVALLGYYVFMRGREEFADVL
jgi:lipopolysaccharide transport system permease protein